MSRARLALLCAALVLIASGCSGLASSAPESEAPRRARATPTPQPTRPPLAIGDLVGSDGRLTVLLLGSDRRKGTAGERTDAIIVATIHPRSGKVALVSLPRDTVNVPTAPGRVHSERINTLYGALQQQTGKRKAALDRLRDALAYAFDTEIDYYALVDFAGLVRLVDAVGGVTVQLDEALVDPTMHLGERGLRLKAGSPRLDGRHALAFSRSRHSTSDYDRSRRQQQVLTGAAERIRTRGERLLPALTRLIRHKVLTDLPLRAAPALLELAGKADLEDVKSIVLEPYRWARPLAGTYTIAPRVLEVHKLFDRLFGPTG
jgi:LCP family protein required for cell wall assembly